MSNPQIYRVKTRNYRFFDLTKHEQAQQHRQQENEKTDAALQKMHDMNNKFKNIVRFQGAMHRSIK